MSTQLHRITDQQMKEGYGSCRGCRGPWTAGFARLTTAPWTTLRVALSHLENCCAVLHTVHSLDDEQPPIERKDLQIYLYS